MLNNFFNVYFQFWVHFFWVKINLVRHLLNDTDDFTEHVRSGLFYECHQIFDFFLFRLIDNHFISFIHEKVEFVSKFIVIEQSVIDFDEAVIFILCFLILSKKLSNVFISLKVLIFEFFKPFLSLFDTDLFHRQKMCSFKKLSEILIYDYWK